ncbi:phosphatidylglycerol lysyltransferase domain-containing protein [Planktotalea sp.]|uniref:phosphatidylglycerol lysyltransferase domain-containing protein n=1 Tax=Planktotalea sp. TaxID=2029877 RepID=UPI00344F47DB
MDIMRNCSNLPAGTMHALVWFAIERAKDKGLSTFSLASTIFGESPALKAIDRFSLRSSVNTDGLEQFKRAFAPRWHPLYAAAPNKAERYLGLWDVWQEVRDPPPIQHQNENA